MNAKLVFWIIFGVALGFNLLWFSYWVIRLFKAAQKAKSGRGKTARTEGSR